eukprot:MONOS_7951.1-p1 / transcript=MONOS_7951.1 / gene=MONOS_7951 / organism=Monocercomonoides_exilis_PA203 / gene_product=deoxyribonuclease II protein, putative / transcript_product=deoxyribonuclease II protein, putative / location=Mono_scaffold00287:1881-3205(+) / protein_length=328 / sequence_SO=supercontig / SO=protein_coding / is_pseudo=false
MFWILLEIFVFQSKCALQCVNPNGNPVDWYMMIKTATQSGAPSSCIRNGTAYTYIDSTTSKLVFLNKDITQTDSPLGRTLLPLYKSQTDLVFMYNDETPDGKTSSSYGHTKGVISYSQNQGFWLVHSVPAFPPPPDREYSFSSKGRQYGQSFLCLSLDANNLNTVGILQQHNHPQIYYSKISSNAQTQMPELAKAMNGSFVGRTPATAIRDIVTRGGQKFRGYGKNAPWGKDLAPNLIVPDINADMIWETWMRPYEKPFCPPRPAKQCLSSSLLSGPIEGGGEYKWKETEDHSKWGISAERKVPVTCIGDINRMSSQRKRGGGATILS